MALGSKPVAVRSSAHAWRLIEEYVQRGIDEGLIVESGWSGKPLLVTKLPAGKGVRFDPERVDRVLKFFSLLRQIKGRWAGQRFMLQDWQVRWEIAPVFGLVDASTSCRIIRTAWIEKPRKNGKSTECSGLALYLFAADREPGAEVYTAAASKDQASIVFKPAKQMAEQSPELLQRITRSGIQQRLLEHPVTHSILRPLAADMSGQGRLHGLNVHGAIVDEVHVHKTPDTIDALETGTGSRSQPLVVFITTADEGVLGSIYDTKRSYVEGIVEGRVKDRTWYAVVFAAPPKLLEGDAKFSDEALIAANPGVGVTVQLDYLRQKADEARSSPRQLNRYLRLHLGQRVKQEVRWFDMKRWDTAGGDPIEWGPFLEEGVAQLRAIFNRVDSWAGLDLSATTDLTAFGLIGVDLEDVEAGVDLAVMCWVPEDRVMELEDRLQIPLAEWIEQGWVKATEGNVVDYREVRLDIVDLIADVGAYVIECGYDPWGATQVVLELGEEDVNMARVNQNYAQLSAASKEVERLVVGSTKSRALCRHHHNPVLRWMADCTQVKSDTDGNIKPVKPDRSKSTARIDGVAATVNGMSRFLARAGDEDGGADQAPRRLR